MSATTTTATPYAFGLPEAPRARTHTYELPHSGDEIAQAQLDERAEHLRAQAVKATPKRSRRVEHGRPADVLAWIDRAPAEACDSYREVGEVLAQAAGTNPTTGDHYYAADDVVAWVERCFEMGATSVPRVGATEVEDVFRLRRVPNAKLRAEYERLVAEGKGEGVLSAIAREALPDAPQPDTSHVLRWLGLDLIADSATGNSTLRLFCNYDQAVAAATVLGLDFHDLGI